VFLQTNAGLGIASRNSLSHVSGKPKLECRITLLNLWVSVWMIWRRPSAGSIYVRAFELHYIMAMSKAENI